MSLEALLLIAFIIEALVETVQLFVIVDAATGKMRPNYKAIGACVMGILVGVMFQVDIFSLAGLVIKVPAVAWVLSGVLLSRGAEFIHQLYNLIKGQAALTALTVKEVRQNQNE